MTSATTLNVLKRRLRDEVAPARPKIGHAGTLDRFATGVLVTLVGSATRAAEAVMSLTKQYDATVRLGMTTETHDPDGPPLVTPAVQVTGFRPPGVEALRAVLAGLLGRIEQRPPTFSALKIGGRRASDRARLGEEVSIRPRVVRIDALDLLAYDWPTLTLAVTCGRGTYVRAIARDVGERLGVGGYLTSLRRTRVGPFGIEEAISPERLRSEGVLRHLRPIPPEVTAGGGGAGSRHYDAAV